MKLYYMPGACSLAPHIVAHEAGLSFELIRVKDGKLPDGSDFKAVNPKGYVPTLQLSNGDVLTEGAVICQYLADQKPELGLAPARDSFDRYRLTEWQVFLSTELHKQFAPLFHGGSKEAQQAAKEKISDRLDYTNQKLQGQDYLMGSQFTVADAYLFTLLNWTKKVVSELDKWSNLKAFHARVAERPNVHKVLQEEGLLTPAK